MEAAHLQGEEGPVTADLVIRRIGDADAEDPFLILAAWAALPEPLPIRARPLAARARYAGGDARTAFSMSAASSKPHSVFVMYLGSAHYSKYGLYIIPDVSEESNVIEK